MGTEHEDIVTWKGVFGNDLYLHALPAPRDLYRKQFK
jgi:hypothetical protein